jgi:hypothetical protein
MSEYISADLRREVADRAQGCCEYCRAQERFSCDPLTVDHIIPRAVGGQTQSDNLALSCFGCNQHKSKLITSPDPATTEPAELFHPRRQHWDEHFTWNNDFTMVLGLSSAGRATIVALKLNREGLVNLRRVLYAIREHPPRPTAD